MFVGKLGFPTVTIRRSTLKRQVVVIGLGRLGVSLAKALHGMGHDVLAIDGDEKVVRSMASQVTRAVQADATDREVLKKLGIGTFDVAVVAMGSAIQSSVLVTLLLKKMGVPYIIARADDDLHGSILEQIGADKVVYVEHEMGIELAHGLTLAGISEYMSMATNYGVVKLTAPAYFVGKTLSQLELGRRGRWKVAVLLIKREKEVIVMPELEEVVQPDDVLLLSGNDDNLERALAEAEQNNKAQSKDPRSAA
jgi:trk/ktr system potassium uptake protein